VTARLARQVYGKSSVRLTKVSRHAERHHLIELSIDVALEGDFSESYLVGDNRRVIPTDTMKNTVYALAADHELTDAESFALVLTNHFIDRNPHVVSATVTSKQTRWQRITTSRGPHRHSFVGDGDEQRTCTVARSRHGVSVESGFAGLRLLKTTDSAFRGFARDEYTTLADADDRIFATRLNARWKCAATDTIDWKEVYHRARGTMIAVFADHQSLAVQQTLFAMGTEALEVCPEIERIELEMSNEHRIAVNLEPFGKQNANEVFVATSEPYGLISAAVEREGK
jgi:urate oxidase